MFEWLSTVESLAWLSGRTIAAYRIARDFLRPTPPALHWIERLNRACADKVIIRCVLEQEPILRAVEAPSLSVEEKKVAAKFRKDLSVNDPVAVLMDPTNWSDRPPVLRYWSTDYATVCALDSLGRRPTILSANALVYCVDTMELILHRRSDAVSRDYPGSLHTFGGGYIPPGPHGRDFDHSSLVRAARRETMEESGISFDINPLPPLLLTNELNIGFVELALLGVPISRRTLEAAEANHEGVISRVKLADLPFRLNERDWVPGGRVHLLSWLALGAPVGRRRLRFGKESGQDLFNRFVP